MPLSTITLAFGLVIFIVAFELILVILLASIILGIIFIVEFVGNGRSARAVVKKGSLSLIYKSTVAGHLATIIDDNR